jgi:hypothetical protein
MIKSIVIAAALVAAFFSPPIQAEAYQQIIPMRVLCTKGGPSFLLEQLRDNYNEQVRYSMEISVDSGYPVGLLITENKNNNDGRGSSTILMVNSNLNMSCVFFTSKDYLKDAGEVDSLPAKQPLEGETDV